MQASRGRGGGPHRHRNGLGGRGEDGEARSEEADWSENLSKTWLLSSAPRRVGKGPGRERGRDRGGKEAGTGEGTRQGPDRRRTLLSPPTARLGPRWDTALVPPSWPRRPGPASSAAPFRVTSRVHARPGGYGSNRGPQPSAAAAPRVSGACVVPEDCCAGGELPRER